MNTNEIPNHFTETALSCKRRNLLCSHSNSDIFTCENNMLFSRVKISCFRTKLTWYIIGVYIINYNSDYYNNICYNCCFNKVAKRFGTLNLQVKVNQKCWKMNELYADRFQAPPPQKKFQGFKFHSPNIARPQRVCPVSRRKWSGFPFLKGSFAKRPCKQVGEVINRKDN